MNTKNDIPALFTVAVILAALCYYATPQSHPCHCSHPPAVAQVQPGPQHGPVIPPAGPPKAATPGKPADVEAMKELAVLMCDRQREDAERTWLVGVMAQHNFSVIQRGLPAGEMIFINRDWTLTGWPTTLELDPAGKELVRNRVKSR